MWGGWGTGSDAKKRSSVGGGVPVNGEFPRTLRSKLVFHPTENKTSQAENLLKRSSTYDLERPGETIGKGSFGTVRLRQDKTTGEPRAVKVVEKLEHWDRARLIREAKIMQNLDHPHFVRLFGWHENGDSITMVMEFCAGGELLDAVDKARSEGVRLHEGWCAMVFHQLFEAMAYLHDRGMIHMDIKSGNILLLNAPEPDIKSLFKLTPHVVVADLGLAMLVDSAGSSWFKKKLPVEVRGTCATMAPEVWRGQAGPKADVYGLGCVLYQVFTSRLPFMPEDRDDQRQETWEKLYKEVAEHAKQRLQLSDCSEDAKNFCWQLLTLGDKERPTAKETLNSAWFARFLASGPKEDNSQMRDLKSLCEAICRWYRLKPLHRAFCLLLAADCKGTGRFASMFSRFDKDSNGVLTQSELVTSLQKLGVQEEPARRAASSLDYNRDGSCEYLEFAAACLSALGEEYDEMLLKEFGLLDSCCTGYLDGNAFNRLLDKLKPICVPRKISLADFDTDGDGLISFPEFATYFGRAGVDYYEWHSNRETSNWSSEGAALAPHDSSEKQDAGAAVAGKAAPTRSRPVRQISGGSAASTSSPAAQVPAATVKPRVPSTARGRSPPSESGPTVGTEVPDQPSLLRQVSPRGPPKAGASKAKTPGLTISAEDSSSGTPLKAGASKVAAVEPATSGKAKATGSTSRENSPKKPSKEKAAPKRGPSVEPSGRKRSKDRSEEPRLGRKNPVQPPASTAVAPGGEKYHATVNVKSKAKG